jgi:hypothetical protein
MGYGGGIILLEEERRGPEDDNSTRIWMRRAIPLLPLYAGVKRGKFTFKCIPWALVRVFWNTKSSICVLNLTTVCIRYFNNLFFVITLVTVVRKFLILQGGRKVAHPKLKKNKVKKYLYIFKIFVYNVLKNIGRFPHSHHWTQQGDQNIFDQETSCWLLWHRRLRVGTPRTHPGISEKKLILKIEFKNRNTLFFWIM